MFEAAGQQQGPVVDGADQHTAVDEVKAIWREGPRLLGICTDKFEIRDVGIWRWGCDVAAYNLSGRKHFRDSERPSPVARAEVEDAVDVTGQIRSEEPTIECVMPYLILKVCPGSEVVPPSI
jgi:hypothetical protein